MGLRGDTIAAIGNLRSEQANRVLDAEGLVLAPGFIDMHSHSDYTLLVDGRGLSKVTQGVTTELLGESSSAGPVLGPARRDRERSLTELALKLDWTTLGEYFDRLEGQGISVNIVSTVGAGQVRACVMGYENRTPTKEEMKRMKELVDQAMRQGAVGLSSGLIYTPNSYFSTEELISLAQIAARYGGIYLTHIRGEDGRLLTALKEAIRIGRQAEVPVEVLHFKRSSIPIGKEPDPSIQEAAALIEKAREEGVSIYANLYPYAASQTSLSVRLPEWSREGGPTKLVQRLRDPRTRNRIRKELNELFSRGIAGATPETILFGSTTHEPHRRFQGMRISEIAGKIQVSPAEAMLTLIDRSEADTRAVYFAMREKDVRYALTLPWTTIGSDGTALAPEGILARSHPHPRWYGSFPRILGHYVREERLLTLEEAIRKMTSLPASRLGFSDRGTVAVGYKGDLVLFDPETTIDRATFEDPHQLSEGVQYLFVNGQRVLDRGEHTGALPGRVLRQGKNP